jgi:hypothetical protein
MKKTKAIINDRKNRNDLILPQAISSAKKTPYDKLIKSEEKIDAKIENTIEELKRKYRNKQLSPDNPFEIALDAEIRGASLGSFSLSKLFSAHGKDTTSYVDNGFEGVLGPVDKETRRNYIKLERSVRAAVKRLCNLPIISDDLKYGKLIGKEFNSKLSSLQRELEETMKLYLKLAAFPIGRVGYLMEYWGVDPYPIMKSNRPVEKQIKQSSHKLFRSDIIGLVDEFKKINYSERQAYIRTGILLNFAYPQTYTDPDPDLVRQRYKYHKKKNNQ